MKLVRRVRNGKSKKASQMSNELNDITRPLQLIHVDLFGSVYVMSTSKRKWNALVMVDDFSKYSFG